MKTIKNERKLKMVWFYKSMNSHFKSNPFDIISHLIGHEANGSLLSLLKSNNFAHDLSSSHHDYADLFTKFEISISLTANGLENYEQIIDAIGLYIKMLKSNQININIFKEC